MLESRSINEHRPIKVIVIGAGISGILAGIRFPQRLQNLDLVIYDKNPEIGGTWYENRYPGVACDIPAHSYQASFEPNLSWSRFYAQGPEILAYWKRVVKKYGVDKYTKLQHKIVGAQWVQAEAKWHVTVQKTDTNEKFQDSCDILFSCAGGLNDWRWPQIKGLHDFTGKLLHSANWDDGFDFKDKDVAVIGIGSSAIQIVPEMQKVCRKVDHYARGKTWIAMPFAGDYAISQNPSGADYVFSEADIKKFQEDPEYAYKYRKGLEHELNSAHTLTIRNSLMQQAATDIFKKNMEMKLASKPEVYDCLLPQFPPACRRLTPGPGFLEAISAPNLNFIPEEISTVTTSGVVTVDGTTRPVDAIICATGFDTTHTGRFPIIGSNGERLSEKWKDYPSTYCSVATDGFPNYFISLGPNAGVGTGSLTIVLENIVDYVCKAIQKMQREAITAMVVKPKAVEMFVKYAEEYFPRTVYSLNCRSWYKRGTVDGKVSALWPGSCLHAVEVLKNPRWEDYEYEYLNQNPLAWLGDGFTVADRIKDADRAVYIDPKEIDYPKPLNKSA